MAASRRKQLHELAQTAALVLSEVEDPDEAAILYERFIDELQDELWLRRRQGRADALLASLIGMVDRRGSRVSGSGVGASRPNLPWVRS